ncbi:MAG: DUF5312 domain-containing protein [Treponema sp.]|jgi:hypothetical protein|nr:DUF5312 domain-containing protein [Treponema sp.]
MAGFLDKLFSLFGVNDDPEAGKKKLVKQLAKDLSGNRFARYYRVKSQEIDGSFGKFFFEVYKIISPAQILMQNAAKSAQLKQVTAEAFLDKNLLEMRRRIDAETIETDAKTIQIKDLAARVKQDLAAFSAAFDSEYCAAIDRCYNLILAFGAFSAFDFFFVLKKFDANITERNFTYQPKFSPVRGEYLSEDLKDFLDVSFAVDPDQDWKNAFRVLKIYKNGVDVAAIDQWNRVLGQLREIRKSGMLELMIRHIDGNPSWQYKPRLSDEHIAEAYLEGRRNEAKGAVDKVINARQNAQIDVLAKTIFAGAEVDRMKYYSEKNSALYTKKNFDGFVHARALNYLRAFLMDHVKKNIRELCDILLVRGQWTAPVLAQQMSESFHSIMRISDELVTFDDTFSDDGEKGGRLKAAIVKADRDKSQARYVTVILKSANEEAEGFIARAAQFLISMGKNLKGLIEDYQKGRHELIMNWKELEGASEIPLGRRMTGTYKNIYYFVQMMQFFAGPREE